LRSENSFTKCIQIDVRLLAWGIISPSSSLIMLADVFGQHREFGITGARRPHHRFFQLRDENTGNMMFLVGLVHQIVLNLARSAG
jgi:hypothetical protein